MAQSGEQTLCKLLKGGNSFLQTLHLRGLRGFVWGIKIGSCSFSFLIRYWQPILNGRLKPVCIN